MSAGMDRVVPGALHDFKNLLTVISGHSELLLAQLKEDDPLWRSAEAIRRAVESGVSLTTQWLSAARREAVPAEDLAMDVPRGTETILVVEADADLRELIDEVLELHGYAVLAAPSVEDAEALAARHTGAIDLMMVDVLARGYGARALTTLWRARPRLKTLYVSELSDQEITRRARGGDGLVLRKPFGVDTLTRCIREVLDESSPTTG